MLAVIRVILLAIALVIDFVACVVAGLVAPRHPNLVWIFSRPFGWMLPLLGVSYEVRKPQVPLPRRAVYVCNHQNTYDIMVCAQAVPPRTVTIGKRSLVLIPLFGIMYWLTGNILIDRQNKSKAADAIANAADKVKGRDMSIWMFPEGTRSRGRGILPFKTGAFRLAVRAEVPIVPLVTGPIDIRLNRWRNGHVIMEYLPARTLVDEADAQAMGRAIREEMIAVYERLRLEQKERRGRR